MFSSTSNYPPNQIDRTIRRNSIFVHSDSKNFSFSNTQPSNKRILVPLLTLPIQNLILDKYPKITNPITNFSTVDELNESTNYFLKVFK